MLENKFESNLESIHFKNINLGLKIYEIRINDEKRRKMNVGDIWIFKCDENKIMTKIIEKILFVSFFDALNNMDVKKVLPNVNDIEEGLKLYESFPNYVEDSKTYGVVRFKIEVIK
jgi:ASC-1-like (ASCH) protein